MTGKQQFDQNQRPDQQSQGGNLGQQDARQEKKWESDLSRMGEMSREKQEQEKRR